MCVVYPPDIYIKDSVYYFVYRTTNTLNGKIYVGAHKTHNIRDSYLGSGFIFKKAVEKYGRDAFKREILALYPSFEEMYKAEKYIVDKAFIAREDTYNLMLGGYGSGGFSDATKKKMSESRSGSKHPLYGVPMSDKTKQAIGSANKKYVGLKSRNYGMTHITNGIEAKRFPKGETPPEGWWVGLTDEHVSNLVEANSNKLWITDGKNNTKHSRDLEIPEGWKPGRSDLCNSKWISKGTKSRMIKYFGPLEEGWCYGRPPKTCPDKIWITDGENNTRLNKELEIPEGWLAGMINLSNSEWISKEGSKSQRIKYLGPLEEGWCYGMASRAEQK